MCSEVRKPKNSLLGNAAMEAGGNGQLTGRREVSLLWDSLWQPECTQLFVKGRCCPRSPLSPALWESQETRHLMNTLKQSKDYDTK